MSLPDTAIRSQPQLVVGWDPPDCCDSCCKKTDMKKWHHGCFLPSLFGGTSLSMITVSCFIYQKSRLQICPLYRFSETKPQMVLVPRDVNIGFQGLAALIQGQIYNPESCIKVIYQVISDLGSGDPFLSGLWYLPPGCSAARVRNKWSPCESSVKRGFQSWKIISRAC